MKGKNILLGLGIFASSFLCAAPNSYWGQADTSPYNRNIRVNINPENQNEQENPNSFKQNPENYPAPSDPQILGEIQDNLRSSYKNYNINVHIERGIVTISGVVFSDQDKQSIERDVRSVSGVKKVDNKIRIGSLKSSPSNNSQ